MNCIANIPHLGTCIYTLHSRSESAHSLLFLSTSCPRRFCINNNCSLPLLYFHAATSHLPRGDQLQHITEFGADPQPVDPTSRPLAPMLLSCGLPPVPTKLTVPLRYNVAHARHFSSSHECMSSACRADLLFYINSS